MVQILLITHGHTGREMLKSLKSILKIPLPIRAVSIVPGDSKPKIGQKIRRALKNPSRTPTLILTDLYGCTHFNQCLDYLRKGSVEIVCGINLPMLMKLATLKDPLPLKRLTRYIKNYGQKNIVSAKEVLKRR